MYLTAFYFVETLFGAFTLALKHSFDAEFYLLYLLLQFTEMELCLIFKKSQLELSVHLIWN